MKLIKRIQIFITVTLFSLTSVASIDVSQSLLSMKVTTDGIYRVTYNDMMALNIDLSGVKLSQIAVFNKGIITPAKIFSDNQSNFGANSYIEFVGLTDDNIYQNGNVYSLMLADTSTIESKQVSADINQSIEAFYYQTDNYADNTGYSVGSPITDPWFAKRILAIGSEKTATLDFNLENLLYVDDINIEMNIWGGTDYLQSPDHHVIYTVNGSDVDDFRFDGLTSQIRNYNIHSNNFSEGLQQITVTVPNDTNTVADVIHIESWKVTYPRAFVMRNNHIDFDIINSTNGNKTQKEALDTIFANGFEVGINKYSIENAKFENYSVYKVGLNGVVESYESNLQGNCSSVANVNCTVDFAMKNTAGHVYIAAESEIMQPQLTVPVFLTDIKSHTGDYLIISHPDFIGEELNEFIQLKQQDFTVIVVDVEQIYAQFNHANVSAQSIADYIKFTQSHFNISNVLLVGGDTYDYNNYLASNSVSFIPTIYGKTGDLINFAPIDAKYSDVDDDNVPDINIGRFPVRSEQELSNLTQKIVAYTNKNYPNTAIFAADKYDVSNGYSFKSDAETLIKHLPQNWQANIDLDAKAYVDDDGIDIAKAKITNQVNQGVALTSFVGHSGPKDWSFSRMFSIGDANALFNADSPTIVTQWGCWNTYFVLPTEDTMAHAFMLNQNGGAASVLGASTLTKAEHEKGLAQLLLYNLTHEEMTLGEATTQAKRAYAQTHPEALDVILGWNLLGDPSLKL